MPLSGADGKISSSRKNHDGSMIFSTADDVRPAAIAAQIVSFYLKNDKTL